MENTGRSIAFTKIVISIEIARSKPSRMHMEKVDGLGSVLLSTLHNNSQIWAYVDTKHNYTNKSINQLINDQHAICTINYAIHTRN